jgi:hypothetical protein
MGLGQHLEPVPAETGHMELKQASEREWPKKRTHRM